MAKMIFTFANSNLDTFPCQKHEIHIAEMAYFWVKVYIYQSYFHFLKHNFHFLESDFHF